MAVAIDLGLCLKHGHRHLLKSASEMEPGA